MSAHLNADVHVKLTLTKKPEVRDKSTGGVYTLARGREGSGDGARFWTLFIYGDASRAEIERLDVGDVLSVQGSFDVSLWRGRGEPEVSLKVNVDRVLPLKRSPRERKPRETGREAVARSWAAPADVRGELDELPL